MEITEFKYDLTESDLSPGEQWNQGASDSLKKTKLGLTLKYVGLIMFVLSVLGIFILALSEGPLSIFRLIDVGLIISSLLMSLGPFICLDVPSESGARGFLIGSVVCQLVNVLHFVGNTFIPKLVTGLVETGFNLCGGIGLILFVLFMKKLAIYINRQDLSVKARNVFIFGIFLMMISLAMFALIILGLIPLISFTIVLVGSLVLFLMYANLVGYLRKALAPNA